MKPKQIVASVVVGLCLILLAFQAGRQSVRGPISAAHCLSDQSAPRAPSAPTSEVLKKSKADDRSKVIIRDIATVPFSELYDVLRPASEGELLQWAHDLEGMRDGPRRRAAVTAFYKSLVQVNTKAAIKAILQTTNLGVRDFAVEAALDAAPENEWADLAEMMRILPHPQRPAFFSTHDLIWNWSRVDPMSAAEFVYAHPSKNSEANDESYSTVFYNWGAIDPKEVKAWFESHPEAQTEGAVSGLLGGWEGTDRAGAISYAIANANRPNFQEGIKSLGYTLLREAPDEARSMILRLPPESAQSTVDKIARTTTSIFLHVSEDYQKPPDVVARWMVTLPPDLWKEQIGAIVSDWDSNDADGLVEWLSNLGTSTRDFATADFCRNAAPTNDWQDDDRNRRRVKDVLTLSLTIQNGTLRESSLRQFAQGLEEDDRKKVLGLIDELPLKLEDKRYLRRVVSVNVK